MNKYEILERIGEGEYGVVLKGRNKETGELVAIKKFKEDDSEEQNRRLILREVKILKTLGHENIIELKEAFRKKGKIYLVCEYVQKNLLQIVEQGPITPQAVRNYAYNLIRGIAYMHSINVIHRDIKPQNVLIGKGNTLKICDLGFARTLPHNQKMTEYVATRWYRPPELLIGGQQYNTSIDMWSAGCVIAEMIDGEPLFPGENDLDQLYLIQKCLGPLIPQQKQLFLKNPKFIGMKFPQIHNLQSIDRRYFGKIDKQGLDLLKKLISMDPAHRLTPEDALRHPFLARAGHEPARKNPLARDRDDQSQQLHSNFSNNMVGQGDEMGRNKVTGLLRSKKAAALDTGSSLMRQNILQRQQEGPKGKSLGSKKINMIKEKIGGGGNPLTEKRTNRAARNKARHRHRPQVDEMEEYYEEKWQQEEEEDPKTNRKQHLSRNREEPKRREQSESPVRKSKVFSKNYRKEGCNIVFNNNTYNLNIVDPYS